MHIPVLHIDQDIIVIDKPIGVATHAPSDDPYPADAVTILRRQLGIDYLGMHQRLDKETSGVLLFSRRPAANPALAHAFQTGQVRKRYLAIVHGVPRKSAGRVDIPIARGRGGHYYVTSRDDSRGRAARTRWQQLDASPDGRFSLLEVTPETGRTHQIRVHLAHIGYPVVGDVLYDPQRRPAPRLMLHALSLTLPHPASGKTVTFTAPAPPVFQHIGQGLAELIPLDWNDPASLRGKLALAVGRRRPLEMDPETSAYRLVHGPADGFTGITIDRFGEILVISLYDQLLGPAHRALIAALAEMCRPQAIYVKHRPPDPGRLSAAELAELAPTTPAWGRAQGVVTVLEDGLRYAIRPGAGLNVGLFLDMREMRGRVRSWAVGKTVLNGFAYTCGFGVAATAGGAARVLNLDLSRPALAWGQENYRLNGFEPDDYDFVYGDLFDWLKRFARRGQTFDMVILDPPGFARARKRTFSAAQDYARLAEMAARVVNPHGMLIACCNVASLPRRAFRRQVEQGIRSAGRQPEVIGVYSEPAVDFPVTSPRAHYLKILVLRLR
ncbi:MAG: class I SAM-dependent methyltransferase [Anaerolineae bacterium]|nr:class I SAM-dependent methyltransferase [Anaerolineae bacterium]